MPCFVGSLTLAAFNCDAFAVSSIVKFSTLSTAGLSPTYFGVVSISIAVQALCQLCSLCVSFRSVYLIIDTEASFDPGV